MSKRSRIVASTCGLSLFLLVVAAQPLLEPSYDPLRQQISEFAHTSTGPVVLIGFLAWGASLLLIAEGPALVAAALGLVLVACFPTDRGAEVAGEVTNRTAAGQVHDIGSGLVLVGILAAVVADAFRERSAAFACIVISAAVASSALLFALGDPLPGLRQRCLVACACLWQAIVLRRLWRKSPTSV